MSELDLSAYRITFSDDFEADLLDENVWSTRYWWGGRTLTSNGELQYFADGDTLLLASHPDRTPFSVSGGVLTITARPTPDPTLTEGLPYVSGMISSFASFSQKFGYFEMRAKVPEGRGLWPAFWLLPADGSWPPEIDVMEMLCNDSSTFYGSLHLGSPDNHLRETKAIIADLDLSRDFHCYGLLWNADRIDWYLDRHLMCSHPNLAGGLNCPMYLLAGLMVGGAWGGRPDTSTRFPANFHIDYVRAYASVTPAPREGN